MVKIDNISLADIYEFVATGDIDNAPEKIITYLDYLDKIRGMYLRINQFGTKETILKHLIKVDGLSRYLANKLYNDTLEYFYTDRDISKDAWRNIIFQKLMNLGTTAELMIKEAKDTKIAAGIYKDAFIVKGLDKEEKEELDERLFQQPWKLYAMEAEFLGLPKINRLQLAKDIDNYPDITEKEKDRLKRDAAILPITLFDEQEDVHK